MLAGHRLFRLVHIGQDVDATFIQTAAGVGEIHAAGGTAKQLHPKPLLQFGDTPADSGLGDPHALGSGADAARLHHPHEGLHGLEAHHRDTPGKGPVQERPWPRMCSQTAFSATSAAAGDHHHCCYKKNDYFTK